MITMTDCRAAGYCATGIRRWFHEYNLDFRDFLKNGIDEATLLATGDACAHKVVELKRKRESARG